MTSTVIRAGEPRDLLAYAQYTIGYVPTDSLVTVCLSPRGRTVGPVTRQDLAPPTPGAFSQQARTVATVAERCGASAVFLVAFTEHDVPAALLATLGRELDTAGLDLLDLWQVDAERYRCLTCSGPCCPPEGRPVAELASSRVGAEMVLRGRVLAAGRPQVVGDLVPEDDDLLTESARAAAQVEDRLRCTGDLRLQRRREALAAWTAAVRQGTGSLDAARVGELVGSLGDVVVRDAVMLATLPSCADAADKLLAGVVDQDVARALDGVLGRRQGSAGPVPSPDPEWTRSTESVLRALVRGADPGRRGRPLGLLAWLAWWRGDGVMADELLTMLEDVDPGHSLGALLRTALERMLPPPWVGAGAVVPEGRRSPE